MSDNSQLEIQVIYDINKALASLGKLKKETADIPKFNTGDFVATQKALKEFSKEAINDFLRIQQTADSFHTDEAVEEFLKMAVSSGELSSQAVENFRNIQMATGNLADEAMEDFLKIHQSMNFVKEESREMGGTMRMMGSQFAYALSDLPMMFVDIRMGMMGIGNNITPMLEHMRELKAEGTSNRTIFRQLASSLMGPTGIIAAITIATMVIPKLVAWFKKDEKAAEEAEKAHKEYLDSLKDIRDITDPEEAKNRIDNIDKQNTLYREQIDNYKDLLTFTDRLAEKQEMMAKGGKVSVSMPLHAGREELRLTEEQLQQLNEIVVRFGLNMNNVEDAEKMTTILKGEQLRLSTALLENENKRKLLNLQIVDIQNARAESDSAAGEKASALTEAEQDHLELLRSKAEVTEDYGEYVKYLISLQEGLNEKQVEYWQIEKELRSFSLESEKGLTVAQQDRLNLLAMQASATGDNARYLAYLKELQSGLNRESLAYWQIEEAIKNLRIENLQKEEEQLSRLFTKNQGLIGVMTLAGNTMTTALLNADSAGEIFLQTMKQLVVRATTLSMFFAGLKMFGKGDFGGLSLGSFLLKGLFGGGFADGGDPPLGKISLVGERGPEMFVPRTAGTIINNENIQKLVAMAGRQSTPVIHIDGGKIPIEGVIRNNIIYLANKKAQKDMLG